ncbi:MAG: cysteine desulfurase [Myxococcaceae bacterium]|nr:cysteine desulfurase [Myxococcaceae bacterium]
MIYLDYNATSPLWPEVAELLARQYAVFAGNPSSIHGPGRSARTRLTAARDGVARQLGCEPKEIVFTGSGSEGAALAVTGAYRTQKKRTKVVTTPIEHPCVLGAVAQLEREGAEVVRTLDPLAAIDERTALCSVMFVNNETGVVHPVAAIAKRCREVGALFHTDAVQAVGRVPCTLREAQADLLSISAHKFGGPVGAGVLVARRGLDLQPLVPGHHEDGRRGGTQAVVLAEALALALERSVAALPEVGPRLEALRAHFERELTTRLPNVFINGSGQPRAPGISNVRFEGADGEALLIALDLEGIHVSSGAACASGSVKPSHVLTAMGLSSAQAQGSLRFSMGRSTTQAELERVIETLVTNVPRSRS